MNEHPKVLFICMGNICRSPLAVAALGRRVPAARVLSRAVTNWNIGKPADPTMTDIARTAYALELGGHRASQVTPEDLAWADIVYIPEKRIEVELLAKTGLEGFNVHLMHADGLEIADPYQRSARDYAAVAASIVSSIEEIAAALEAGISST